MKNYTLLLGVGLAAILFLTGNEVKARDFGRHNEKRIQESNYSRVQVKKPVSTTGHRDGHDGYNSIKNRKPGCIDHRPCRDIIERSYPGRKVHIPGSHCTHGTPCRDVVLMSYPPRTVHLPGTFCNH